MSTHVTSGADEQGFSLLETLAVLSLIAVVAAIIATATPQFAGLLRVEEQMVSRMALNNVVRHVATLLEQADDLAFPVKDSREAHSRPLEGKANTILFHAVARRGAHSFGLRQMVLRVDEGGRLVQKMIPRNLGDKSPPAADEIELARDVTEFSLSYYGHRRGMSKADWQDDWRESESLPIAIAVRIVQRKYGTDVSVTEVARLNRT